MTFGEHLEELRTCLFRALVGLMIAFLVALPFGARVVRWIQYPLNKALRQYRVTEAAKDIDEQREELIDLGYSNDVLAAVKKQQLMPERVWVHPNALQPGVNPGGEAFGSPNPSKLRELIIWKPADEDIKPDSLGMQEPFVIYIKGAVLVGLILASPWIFYQIWSFVAAGLYPHEKRYVHVFLPFSVGLFLAGAATAFFFVFEPVLKFLLMFNQWMGIDPRPRITEWLGFVLILPIGFGISFQLPLVMLFLERIGVFTVESYLRKWRIAVLVIFVLAMFLTPADPTSMMLMAIPLTALYFGGVALCRFMPKISRPYGSEES
jgi:sec-independent protein translocase protein TatC